MFQEPLIHLPALLSLIFPAYRLPILFQMDMTADNVTRELSILLNEPSYGQRAQKIARMLADEKKLMSAAMNPKIKEENADKV